MPQILVTPEAHRDLVEIGLYIAQDSLKAADKMLTAIDRACKTLSHSPAMGRKREELAVGLRSFPLKSHVVFYRVTRNGIEIIRVLHGARDIESEFFS